MEPEPADFWGANQGDLATDQELWMLSNVMPSDAFARLDLSTLTQQQFMELLDQYQPSVGGQKAQTAMNEINQRVQAITAAMPDDTNAREPYSPDACPTDGVYKSSDCAGKWDPVFQDEIREGETAFCVKQMCLLDDTISGSVDAGVNPLVPYGVTDAEWNNIVAAWRPPQPRIQPPPSLPTRMLHEQVNSDLDETEWFVARLHMLLARIQEVRQSQALVDANATEERLQEALTFLQDLQDWVELKIDFPNSLEVGRYNRVIMELEIRLGYLLSPEALWRFSAPLP